ncbi:hypothetical protein D1AOALGA4SA_12240 [Olavius algarvensis Delta 1 endosymbiont]|nr:hypothetical protein D1AOALGA4SA_12240 [Olavius algarvensis Delta 1 endosymbiont]
MGDLGIQELGDLGIEGILPAVRFCVERFIITDRAQRFHKSAIRNLQSAI